MKRHVSRKLQDMVPPPGPGDYTPLRSNSFSQQRGQHSLKPGRSFARSRRWHSDSALTPGPVNYWSTRRDQQNKWGRGQPRFSEVPRERGSALTPRNGPGPGDYRPYGESPKAQGSFPRTKRWGDDSSQAAPGPVSYWHTRRERDEASIQPRASPKFSTSRRALTEAQSSPGPGDYAPSVQAASSKRSIPLAKRWQSESLETPGPVSYWHTGLDFSTKRGSPTAINGQPKFSIVPRRFA